MRPRLTFASLATILGLFLAATIPAADEPLQSWRSGVTVRPVSTTPGRHTIHTYYTACPESPDGSRVLFFASSTRDGHHGELCVLDRTSGHETVIARDIETEDAHRAACQQWTSGGKRVAFHNVQDGQWRVEVVDLDTLERRVLVRDRQLGFGQPTGDIVPLYGCHWNPGEHRDLELVDVGTGKIEKVLTLDAVRQTYGDWLQKQFGDKPISIFFPVISPDEKRVMFKIACGSGGNNFRSGNASVRIGLIAYDLAASRFLFLNPKWGHPAWHPDSRRVLEVGNLFLDTEDRGKMIRVANLPVLRGSHPSVSPDGRLFVTDGLMDKLGGKPGEWGIVVSDARGGEGQYQILHRFDNSRGARSWRRNDPHPAFSHDGRRVYFNVSEGDWTQLCVAEEGEFQYNTAITKPQIGSLLKSGQLQLQLFDEKVAEVTDAEEGVRYVLRRSHRLELVLPKAALPSTLSSLVGVAFVRDLPSLSSDSLAKVLNGSRWSAVANAWRALSR